MPDETENLTLRLLREMREESRQFRAEVQKNFQQAQQERQEMRDQLDSIQAAVGGVAYIQADQRLQFEELAARVQRLEEKLGLSGEPAE